ncbi:MAG: VWA domain-containing protein [Desulfomicrobium escambiense]|nr:VWA domain-containing protein [Desulfomicrobium escambiense]
MLAALAILGLGQRGNAAEIIYQEDIIQNVVTKDVLVRTADNVIVLVDASSSMGFAHRKYKKTNYEMEKEALAAGYSRLPDLGYNVGIYNFSPAWKEIYPVQKFDAAKVSEAMKQLPAKPSGRTPLVAGLRKAGGRAERPVGEDRGLHFQRRRLGKSGRQKGPRRQNGGTRPQVQRVLHRDQLRRGPGRHQAGQGHGQGQCLLAGDPLRFLHHQPLLCLGAAVLHEVRDVGRDHVREENRGHQGRQHLL